MPDSLMHTAEPTPSLKAEHICKGFDTGTPLTVLDDVTLELTVGESIAIMGPSGSGKSTLLSILGTLDRPDTGQVSINSIDPFALGPKQLARFRNQRIGFVFQEHHLLPQCNALENVLIPTLLNRGDDTALERGRELLDLVGLSDRSHHRPGQLSGGERQRVAIARALINRPALLLADEPTGNLDRRSAKAIGDLLLDVHHRWNTMLVIVTHSPALAARASRRYELENARLIPVDGGRPS